MDDGGCRVGLEVSAIFDLIGVAESRSRFSIIASVLGLRKSGTSHQEINLILGKPSDKSTSTEHGDTSSCTSRTSHNPAQERVEVMKLPLVVAGRIGFQVIVIRWMQILKLFNFLNVLWICNVRRSC